MSLTKKNYVRLLLKCFLISGCIVGGLYVRMLMILALLLAAFFILYAYEEDILCILVFVMPLTPIFKINLGGFALFNILILIAILRLIVLNKFNIPFGLPFIIFSAFVLVTGINNGFSEVISFISYNLLGIMIYKPSKISLINTIRFLTVGIALASVLALLKDYIPGIKAVTSEATIKYSAGVYYHRFSGLENNPNYYTMILSIVIAVIVLLIMFGKASVFEYLSLVVLLIFGFMSASNSFIIGLLVTSVMMLLFMSKTRRYNRINMFIGFVIVGILVWLLLNQNATDALLFRFERISLSKNGNEITSGRTNLWIRYVKYFMRNNWKLIIGNGIGASQNILGAAHNFYIDLLYHLGIIGSIIYIYLMHLVFNSKRYIGGRNHEIVLYLPWIVFFTRAFARNLIASEQLIFLIIICSLTVVALNDVRNPSNAEYV